MTEVRIGKYQGEDVEILKRLSSESLAHFGAVRPGSGKEEGLDTIEKTYLEDGEFLVAKIGDEIVGMGGLVRVPGKDGVGEIRKVRVRVDQLGRGIGPQIAGMLEDRARAMGLTKLQLDTTVAQIAAINMWERLGYKEVRRVPGELETDILERVYMEKELEPAI